MDRVGEQQSELDARESVTVTGMTEAGEGRVDRRGGFGRSAIETSAWQSS